MQKHVTSIYSYTVILSLVIAPVLRLLGVILDASFLNVLFMLIVFFALGVIVLDSFKNKDYANAFEGKGEFHLDTFSYIAAGGFFISFVTQCVLLCLALMAGRHNSTYILPIIMSGIGAIVSSVYYVIVGFYFGEKNYDFREFKLIHVLPILWAISCIFNLLEISSGFEKDIDSFLKYLMMILLAGFFYMFASEVDSKGKTKAATILLARAYSYIAVLYFFDRLILLLGGKASFISGENALAVSCVMISSFTFFFEKNILSKSNANKQ